MMLNTLPERVMESKGGNCATVHEKSKGHAVSLRDDINVIVCVAAICGLS